MARARNIKPAFFLNDDLAEQNCALGRLLFIGLWTLADFKGELEWRAGRIKAQLLPYDECDIKQLAINLDKSGFIRFYSDGDKIYINIPKFDKHQNPHKNERVSGSEVPAFTNDMRQLIDLEELAIIRDLSRAEPERSASNPADSLLLDPDSLLLNPLKDIRTAEADAQKTERAKAGKDLDYSSWPAKPSAPVLKDWLAMRKTKRAPVSQTVINRFARQMALASAAGWSVDDCLAECIARGWTGFEYQWLQKAKDRSGYSNGQPGITIGPNGKPMSDEDWERKARQLGGLN